MGEAAVSLFAARQNGVNTLNAVPEPVSTVPGSCKSVPGNRFTETPSLSK